MESLEGIIAVSLPIFICVVLPVTIVYILARARMNSDNQRAAVLIKAIETNNDINTDKLTEALQKPAKTQREILNSRLLRGCIFTLVGIGLVAVGIYNYATLTPEIVNDSGTIPSIIGGISLAIGISYLIVYFVTRKQIPADEKK